MFSPLTAVRVALVSVLFVSATAVAEGPWRRHTIDNTSRGADGVRLADANGDGLLDIATGWEEGGLIRVYLNPGPQAAKVPWPAVTVGEVQSPEDAMFVDLDGDGALDVVSCCEGNNRSVFVHWAPSEAAAYRNSSAWQTEAIPALQNTQRWMYALPLQIDGQHGVDLVVGSKNGGSVTWLQAPENPRDLAAWKSHRLYDASWIMSLQAIDMDADGDRDILLSDRKGSRSGLKWLEHPGEQAARAGKPWKTHLLGAAGMEIMFLALGDINGDQQDEIVLPSWNKKLLIFQRQGNSWRQQEWPNPFETPHGKAVAIGDLDGDQLPDLVHTANNGGQRQYPGVTWTSSREKPLTAAGPRVWHDLSGREGVKFDLIELIDLDHDGDLDCLTCEERDNLGVVWYENPQR